MRGSLAAVHSIGDFNAPHITWKHTSTSDYNSHYPTNSTEKAIVDFSNHFHLTQHINFPTRKENTLDLLFSNGHVIISSLTHLPPFGTFHASDHDSFSFCIGHSKNSTPNKATFFQFHKANYTQINQYLMSINWHAIFTSCPTNNATNLYDPLVHINSMYAAFSNVIQQTINTYVPLGLGKGRQHTLSHLPKHIQSLYKYRIRLWNETNRDKNKLKICTGKINKEINKFMRYKERKQLSKIKTRYKYVGAFLKSKPKHIPTLVVKTKSIFTETEKSNVFADTFETIFNKTIFDTSDIISSNNSKTLNFVPICQNDVYRHLKNLRSVANASTDNIPDVFLLNCCDGLSRPLTYLFQFIVMAKVLPDIWKKSIISPIPKIVNSCNPIDYRPISLLCASSKIFEKLIFEKITNFLEENEIIPTCQHGFRHKRSVITSLTETFEDLSIAHENNLATDVIYFDLSKAFDSVPINRLISKLSSYGICGPLLDLISFYLSNRSYTVRVGKSFSLEKHIPSGVPQGSVAGPILFIAYIADLHKYCNVENVTIKLFADDLKAYSSSNSPEKIVASLNNFIEKFTAYCQINGLSINHNKCEVLHVGTKM